jgi:transcriptional regulator with XRE-family HTH domain
VTKKERMIKMPDSKTIGRRIKNLRESKHYSQEKLGELVGVSTSTICMYEIGERIPRDELKIKISSALGKSVNYIFFKE